MNIWGPNSVSWDLGVSKQKAGKTSPCVLHIHPSPSSRPLQKFEIEMNSTGPLGKVVWADPDAHKLVLPSQNGQWLIFIPFALPGTRTPQAKPQWCWEFYSFNFLFFSFPPCLAPWLHFVNTAGMEAPGSNPFTSSNTPNKICKTLIDTVIDSSNFFLTKVCFWVSWD